jgi:c(7)-type cytochrome triheme protein
MTSHLKTLLVVAGLAFAGAAFAEALPNLPKALKLPMTGESPGAVTFSHDMHVDAAKPACLTCHPKPFGILGRSSPQKKDAITHAVMDKGENCGACHGKEAFGFEDCTMCHAQ